MSVIKEKLKLLHDNPVVAWHEHFWSTGDFRELDIKSADDYVALISNYENVPLLATGFSMFGVKGEFSELVKSRGNIFFDTTATALLDSSFCEIVKRNVSEEQICFGSLSPFNYIETNLLRIELSGLDADKIKPNGARAFKLERECGEGDK